MNPEILGGLFRHILTVAGGYFVAKGVADADTVTTIVSAVVSLFGAGWSVWAKMNKPAA